MDIDAPIGTHSVYDMQVATFEAGRAEVKTQSEKNGTGPGQAF